MSVLSVPWLLSFTEFEFGSDPFLIPTCDGGPDYVPLELPPLDAPLGKCRGCTFIAPMSPHGLCGACQCRRQCAP